jgi:hypothetical protein
MRRQWSIKQIRHKLGQKEGKYLIGFYGGFGIFFGATLSDFYNTNVPNEGGWSSIALGMPINLTFGIATFAALMVITSLKQRPNAKLELKAIYTFVLSILIAAVYMICAHNPGVLPWLGSHSVLISLITALYFHDPVGSAIAEKTEKKMSGGKRDLLTNLWKIRHGDYVKCIDLAILGSLALFTITMAWLNTQLARFENMGVSYAVSLVYGLWFAYNFVGLMIGVICQLFEKLAEVDQVLVTLLENTP